MLRIKLSLVLLVACCDVAVTSAAWEVSVQVLQPVITEESLDLSAVTYVYYSGTYEPAVAIQLTCDENCVRTVSGWENRNIANRMGLTVRQYFNPQDVSGVGYGLFGDTLRVVLDTSGLRAESTSSVEPDTVVAATLECILANAHRSTRVRYLDIRVAGDPRYEQLGRTWDLSGMGDRPRRRRFWE